MGSVEAEAGTVSSARARAATAAARVRVFSTSYRYCEPAARADRFGRVHPVEEAAPA
ncbi:hypothetical protein GCM10010259_61270 [Streptomyces daghestanicus]|uniref:Uncharacterized protein n=1 Tax=Streptomyces daghestanicus TaxID=66885 RepID=A0ABQ3Q7P8_9ACTN|nr:hypothetical protein GCM10010259_61270 [Streptomyces daghestanicus]GHI33282.1 hypothetical protein Sdagh_50120 [Streptomyces daghestanicus]